MKENLFPGIRLKWFQKSVSWFLLLLVLFTCSCAAGKKGIREDEPTKKYTVKVINSSFDKVLLRYQLDDLSYTFRFVDSQNNIKFTMNGELTIQYSLVDYDNAKIIKIKQDTLIHIKQNDIIIDDLPAEDKVKTVPPKSLEKKK